MEKVRSSPATVTVSVSSPVPPGILGAMRQAFAHDAILDMAPDADTRAPGAAITVALCGHWDHQPPCPLAPHHTEPDRADLVRQRIDDALSGGELSGPDGGTTRWQLRDSRPGEVTPAEADHAERLTRT
jgi:hypothetical protein